MEKTVTGKIIKGVGGIYTVRITDETSALCGREINCRARGSFRYNRITPLPGDNVTVSADEEKSVADIAAKTNAAAAGAVIDDILERRNSLLRPPFANLDFIFITLAAASPAPMLITVDKLISIAEYNRIEPVIIVTKADLNGRYADTLCQTYRLCGFSVFRVSCDDDKSIIPIKEFIASYLPHRTAAFAGASGVGKSTLMNRLFPEMPTLKTSEVSRKTERGRHTTRSVELFPLGDEAGCGYIADTPGFSLIDFERFDFFPKEELAFTMREFEKYSENCRYSDCTHTKEEGCAVLDAVKKGEIPKSRHDSFIEMYNELKAKKIR